MVQFAKYGPAGPGLGGIHVESERLPRKHYFLALALVFAAVAFALVLALCAAIDRRLFSNGANFGVAGGVIAAWMPIGVAVFMPIAATIFFARKPSRPPNHPRIEHLRIAGKYAPTSPAKMGVSPLHLE